MAEAFTCGVCLEACRGEATETSCCGQALCRSCFDTISDRTTARPQCPFCRRRPFSVRATAGRRRLDGVWDVRVTEKCPVGRCTHSSTLSMRDRSGSCDSDIDHLQGCTWDELTIGHTPSGQTFTATQKIQQAPAWSGDSTTVWGHSRVTGRRRTLTEASFTATVTLMSAEGETMEIVQEGVMTLRDGE